MTKSLAPFAMLSLAVALLAFGWMSLAAPSPVFTVYATDLPTYRTILLLLAGTTLLVFGIAGLLSRPNTNWV